MDKKLNPKLKEKAKKKIKNGLANWEKLSEKDKGKTAEAIVLTSLLDNWDEFWDDVMGGIQAYSTGICPRCNQPSGKTLGCKICDTFNEVKEKTKAAEARVNG